MRETDVLSMNEVCEQSALGREKKANIFGQEREKCFSLIWFRAFFFFFLISIKFKQLFTEKSDVFTYMVNHYECDKSCHQ